VRIDIVIKMQITLRGVSTGLVPNLHLMKYTDMVKLFNIIFWLSIISSTVFAQQIRITGKVINVDGKGLADVNIALLKTDNNVLVKTDITDENGTYAIEVSNDGDHVLKATFPGYEPYTSEKLMISNDDIALADIKLKSKSGTLKETVVRAQKPFIEVQADKIVVNVENSIVSAGSSALEVLSRSPGVRVDHNDNISLKGKQGVNILIDGKTQPVSGADLANILKSMPSGSIDRIEIISNPGSKYDAAGNAGIINIRTKKDQRIGLNGSMNASYAQGVYPKWNTGLNLNYRNKKLSAYLNYSFAYRYWFNHLMLNRRFYDTAHGDSEKLFTYDQDNYALFNFRNHNLSAGADYSFSKNTSIGFSVNGGRNKFNPRADNASRALGPNDELLYYFNTKGRHKNRYYNYAGNLNFKHSFDTSGKELTADIDYAAFGTQSNQDFITNYTGPDGSQFLPDYFLQSDLTGFTRISSVKADYTNPIKPGLGFDIGVKTSYVRADNEPLFYEKIAGVYQLDIVRSNHFIYNENINAAYVNAKKEWTKWNTQLGLRLENTNANWEQKVTGQKFERHYSQLFPSLALQRHIDKKNDLGITLSRRIERPGYQQLNPFKYFIDKTTYRAGYPYLQPALSYNVELSHTYKQRFITSFTYSITNDVIAEVIQPSDDEDSVTVQTNKNLTRMTYYGISGAYSPQISKWWTNTTNFNVYYALYEGNVANTNLKNGAPTFDINITNAFTLPMNMSAELGLFYQARQLYAYMDVRPVWMLNAGLQKNLFNKKATIRLNIQDIFWTGYPRATSTYLGYQEDFVAERDTRQATVAFTYRFGKKAVAPVRRRSGGAEDEKRRAGTGNT
jgi:hypothetical protein